MYLDEDDISAVARRFWDCKLQANPAVPNAFSRVSCAVARCSEMEGTGVDSIAKLSTAQC